MYAKSRTPDKILLKITSLNTACVISLPNPMFDHLLVSSRRDDSNKWSNIEFGEEIGIIEIKIHTLSGVLKEDITFLVMVSYEYMYAATAMVF